MLRNRSVLLPRGVDPERFRPDVPPRLGLRAKLRVAPGDVVVGCVAHLLPVKGHLTLIEALAAVPGARLWLAGRELDPEHAAVLRRAAREAGVEGRVDFLDEVRDVPAFLSELDVFALPTWDQGRMEGCPVALLEAMASGRACVSSDIPGSRDIVEAGRNGLLVAPRDAASLAEALGTLVRDTRRRHELGAAARARILDAFSIDREVRAHEDLYARALGLREALAA
jgi:glycosyltransferase involved in cell wall biosynthesis